MTPKDFEKAKKLAVIFSAIKETVWFLTDGLLIIFAASKFADDILMILALLAFLILKAKKYYKINHKEKVEKKAKEEIINEITNNNSRSK